MKCRKNKNKGIDFEQQKKAKESKQNKVLKLNTHTLDDGGEKMDPKIPEEEEGRDSLDPKSSEVNEEEAPFCLFPSILPKN